LQPFSRERHRVHVERVCEDGGGGQDDAEDKHAQSERVDAKQLDEGWEENESESKVEKKQVIPRRAPGKAEPEVGEDVVAQTFMKGETLVCSEEGKPKRSDSPRGGVPRGERPRRAGVPPESRAASVQARSRPSSAAIAQRPRRLRWRGRRAEGRLRARVSSP
jgi:hypothetical protein